LLGSLLKLIICIIIVSIVVAKVISNTVTEPIRYLERKVRLIANKRWVDNIELDRKDEIGRLAHSIGKMQNNLEKLDKEEEFFLQSISHELKTPIMIIKNYCQALKEGIYIQGSKERTIEVIEEEIDALGHKIGKLLYISSLDYVLEKESEMTYVMMRPIIETSVERIFGSQKKIALKLKLVHCACYGIEEKLTVALENILENCVRYAHSYVLIAMEIIERDDDKCWLEIRIVNDGNKISKEILEHLFDKFYKGNNGNFGLGLFITKRIIEFHKGTVGVENIEGEVIFNIRLPINI